MSMPIPDAVPASAFLQESDAPGKARVGSGDQPLPAFCSNSYETQDQVGVRATKLLLISSADAPADATSKAAVYEDVIVFRADGAETFMMSLRAAVTDCPEQTDDDGVTVRNYLRGETGVGDDSVLVERTRPATDEAGEPIEGELHHLFWAAVRHGDTIVFLSNTGWESASADRADTVTLATRTAARLSEWRG